MTQRFTSKAENAIRAAAAVASDLGHTYIGSEHLLFGLVDEGEGVAARLLEGAGVNSARVREHVAKFTGVGHKSAVGRADMTPRLRAIIEESGRRAKGGAVGTEHLLAALLSSEGAIAKRILSAMGTDVSGLVDDLAILLETHEKGKDNKRNKRGMRSEGATEAYGRDLSAMAAAGELDPLIGRERETERLIRILTRRRKNNPCLVGDPGVGKTAVVEGLATRILDGSVPSVLLGKRILSLDISSLIAGAKYRGEFEERMKGLLERLRQDPSLILFIDEIHTIVGAGAAEGAIDAANILKPVMARGEIRVIGATTLQEYRRHIEQDAALERRFQPLLIEPPTEGETLAILKGLRPRYEAHHALCIGDDALTAAIDLSVRYIPDRFLPDKAVDLVDEAAAAKRIAALDGQKDRKNSADIIRQKEEEKEEAILLGEYERAAVLRDEIAAIGRADKSGSAASSPSPVTVTADDIAAAVSEQTGIPTGALTEDEGERLARLEGELSARVIGQERAVCSICQAVRRARTGLRDSRKPIGSFLFLGPTGVGKTELCRALAEAYFGSERALLRFDMSEYMEKHAVARLIGSPPGYVGFEEEGLLSAAVRRRPYAVVLFDEIEKAHPDVTNLLLQVLDDGVLTDSHGHRVEFRNAVVVMTSNLGAEGGRGGPLGFADIDYNAESKRRQTITVEALHRFFRPELISRIDEVVIFGPLSREVIQRVAKKALEDAMRRMAAAGYRIVCTDAVTEHIVRRGYSPEQGARAIQRAVLHLFEDAFSQEIVAGHIQKGIPYRADAIGDAITFSLIEKDPNAP